MKVAILHDYFDKRGGGERLVINLARSLKADIYTGFIDNSKTFDTSGLNITDLGARGFGLQKRLDIARRFEKYNFPRYDAYIFSGVWCISAAKRLHPNVLYLHTPMRMMYDLRGYYLERMGLFKRAIFRRFERTWKEKDQEYMRNFDIIGSNSLNVKKRVLRFYGKDVYRKTSAVYTGIETKKYYYKESGDFYLSAARLDQLKRIDMIIEAFKETGKRLVIAGTGPEEKRLKRLAAGAGNIEFLGRVSDEKLRELYATCRATIAANIDEDLGLIAIESHASGKPVVAAREGGFLETVNKDNGVFFENKKNINKAIDRLERKKWNYRKIQSGARKYDISNFSKNIIKLVSKASAK
jgi:glycosyltransferase involved in cell wall biosynthesis